MKTIPMFASLVLAGSLFASGCGSQLPADQDFVADEVDSQTQAVSCPASMQKYPVNGLHNNGYDATWATWKCTPDATSVSNSDYGPGHLGNDIFAARGTRVVAARGGTVRLSFTNAVGGNVVYIKDDCGWWYYYAHLDRVNPALALGQRVTAGAYLGDLGNSGSAAGTRPHLHFSVYPDGDYNAGIDPYPLLRSVESTACTMSCLPICS